MNREEKAALIDQIASQIEEAQAVFAIDYRGISVPQAAELRGRLAEAEATFRIVKNRLTLRAVDKAGAEQLKEVLEGPTAFTFVSAGGDPALAAKAIDRFRREHELLEFKGGTMGGEPMTVDELLELARLPGLDVLHARLVGVVASPLTGVARGLGSLISGLAIQLGQIRDQGLVGGEEPEPKEEPEPEVEPEAEEQAEQETKEEQSDGD